MTRAPSIGYGATMPVASPAMTTLPFDAVLFEGRGLPVKHFGEQLRVRPGEPMTIAELPLAA
jgi:hypothetical protein